MCSVRVPSCCYGNNRVDLVGDGIGSIKSLQVSDKVSFIRKDEIILMMHSEPSK